MRLAADDLVTLEDHKGFRVAPVSQEELVDLAMTWFELEALGIRQSIEKGDDRWAANIKARFKELSKHRMRTPHGTIDADWEPHNLAFHESLYAACGSPSLMRFCRVLSERFSRYRRLWARRPHARNIAKEHEDLVPCRAQSRHGCGGRGTQKAPDDDDSGFAGGLERVLGGEESVESAESVEVYGVCRVIESAES